MFVEIQELINQGDYVPVEIQPRPDVPSAGNQIYHTGGEYDNHYTTKSTILEVSTLTITQPNLPYWR
jgi:hypothetical protein